ncbi:MAG: iron ABC transporter permease [Actinomycetales bacterium]|nr:iron ABC transporter permease [Actinomycetales bacterium]
MTRSAGSMKRIAVLSAWSIAPVLVLIAFFIVPVGAMMGQGLWPGGRFDPGGIVEVLTRPRIRQVIAFTLWSAGLSTIITVVLGMPIARLLYATTWPGRRIFAALFLVPFVLPTVVVGVAFRLLLSESGRFGFLGLDGSATAIILAMVFFNLTVVVRIVGIAWENRDPRAAEAAASLGANPMQVFWTVTLPALAPAVAAAASVVFLFAATAFGVVLTLGGLRYSTVETEIYLLTVSHLDLQGAAALSIVQLLIVIGLMLLSSRVGRSRSTGGRARATPRPVQWRDAPAAACLGLGFVLIGAPLVALLSRAVRFDGAWSLEYFRRLSAAGDDPSIGVSLGDALETSLRVAVDATLIAVVLGLWIALLVTRRPRTASERRLLGGIDAIFVLPLGVSAVTLGFGFLIALNRPPLDFRDSAMLVPLAQALVALPLVVRTLTPVLRGIDERMREAATSLGANPRQVLTTIDLPRVSRPLVAAAGFAFAVSMGEFGATSFVARADSPTLPLLIYRLIGRPGEGHLAMAAAAAVVLALVIMVVVVVSDRSHERGVAQW